MASVDPGVRDQLCQIIRQHKLDPELVKAYAVGFCGTKTRKDLKEIGWTPGREMAKLAWRGQHFDCAPCVHKTREMLREDFRQEVEKELTGKEEPQVK